LLLAIDLSGWQGTLLQVVTNVYDLRSRGDRGATPKGDRV
jgi:hypothetical protein